MLAYCGYQHLCEHYFHNVTALFATFDGAEQHWPTISRRGSDSSRGGAQAPPPPHFNH